MIVYVADFGKEFFSVDHVIVPTFAAVACRTEVYAIKAVFGYFVIIARIGIPSLIIAHLAENDFEGIVFVKSRF